MAAAGVGGIIQVTAGHGLRLHHRQRGGLAAWLALDRQGLGLPAGAGLYSREGQESQRGGGWGRWRDSGGLIY